MHLRTAILYLLPGLLLLSSLCGCSRKPKSYAPDVDPVKAGYALLEQYDANSDSVISGAELDKAASLKSNLQKIDLDNNKAVTCDELADRIRYWQSTDIIRTRTPIHCTVYNNKKFLADADVKFVPEKFLGDKMKIAKGKTNANGLAILVVENSEPNDPPGIGPGYYRVEINKAGEDIPAKYNTSTILGIDTTVDNPNIYKGIRFELEYKEPVPKP
jgi:hypothetical protein